MSDRLDDDDKTAPARMVDELLKRNAELIFERDAAVAEMQMEQYECVRAQEDADELRRERDEARADSRKTQLAAQEHVTRLTRERDEARADRDTFQWQLDWAHTLLRVHAPHTEYLWNSPPEGSHERAKAQTSSD